MKVIRPKPEILTFGTVDDGKKLLINSVIDGISRDLITFTADDEDESIWVEIECGGYIVQIPLDLLKKAIDIVPEEVHSETWYQNHVYRDGES